MKEEQKYITIIGGGHGTSNLLKVLRNYSYLNIIGSCTDSGGSSGKIKEKLSLPAFGDLRLILTTLSNRKVKLFLERRLPGYTQKGCIGNLILASLTQLYDMKTALRAMHDLLGIPSTQKVIPTSYDLIHLGGEYNSGKIINKEHEFNEHDKIINIWHEPNGIVNQKTIEAINKSELIIISPGSFFTSICTNLMFKEICEAINKKEKVIWIANIMQQDGETIGMNIQEHYDFLSKYININYIILNDRKIPIELIKEYYPNYIKQLDDKIIKKNNKVKIIKGNFIWHYKKCILHNAFSLYRLIKKILQGEI